MQCLSSPTRSEIDKAHSQGIWLDIGVPSVRNLRRLSKTRIVLWWLLAISSIPLHLLYNSAVFSTLCTQQYSTFIVTNEFLTGGPFNLSSTFPGLEDGDNSYWQDILQEYQNNQTSFVHLDNKECVDTYTAPIIPTNSDLLLISDTNATNSLIWYELEMVSNLVSGENGSFFCGLTSCQKDGTVSNPRDLSLNASALLAGSEYDKLVNVTIPEITYIDYCLSKRVREHCKLQFSLTIMIVVIVCNMVKTVCMAMIFWKQDPEPLVTLGDAIASFLDRPDVTSERNCIAGRAQFENSRYWGLLLSRWDPKRLRWFRAASQRRWLACNVL